MNLFTFNSKLFNCRIFRSTFTAFWCLSVYQILVTTKIIASSKGINQWDGNFIRIQKYAYDRNSPARVVIVGSSLANNLSSYFDTDMVDLSIPGGCSQTGLEAFKRRKLKSSVLLVEINGTISRKSDETMLDAIYNPLRYNLSDRFSMLRQEYQPASVILPMILSPERIFDKKPPQITNNEQAEIKPTVNPNQALADKLILQYLELGKNPLSKQEINSIQEQSEHIKLQISDLKKEGVRVVLFRIPSQSSVDNTLREKQIRALLISLFPNNKFEWLPEPPVRNWNTRDGSHLVASDAQFYAKFVMNQLSNR